MPKERASGRAADCYLGTGSSFTEGRRFCRTSEAEGVSVLLIADDYQSSFATLLQSE